MLYGRYLFSAVFQDDAVLPWYKGSTFRGVFGHALKRVVCALRRQDCHDCLLREKCIYSFVFEAQPLTDEPNRPRRIASAPHPYVIEPPDNTRTHYKKRERFDFVLLLFGKGNDYLPYFIYALLPFHVLTRAMLRRISSLCNYHGNGEPPLDYKGLVKRANAVEVSQSLEPRAWLVVRGIKSTGDVNFLFLLDFFVKPARHELGVRNTFFARNAF